jgi:DNA polymerase-4
MPVCAEIVSTVQKPPAGFTAAPLRASHAHTAKVAHPTIAHVHIDGFFASVEQALRPRLHGKPVLVGQQYVLSASYEAKLHGISTGMPVETAHALCPNAVVFAARFNRYAEYAERLRAILESFTPAVDSDASHGFYLHFFGSPHLDHDFPGNLRRLQLEILKQTGLSVSVGAAKTKVVAAIASRIERPRGLRILAPGSEAALLDALPVAALHGIGQIESSNLRKRGISTICELRRVPLASLQSAYGDALAQRIWHHSRGLDTREAPSVSLARSLSRAAAIDGGTLEIQPLDDLAEYLCARISIALGECYREARSLNLRISYTDHFSASQSLRLLVPSNDSRQLIPTARALLQTLLTRPVPVSSLCISVVSMSGALSDGDLQRTAVAASA